MMQNILLTIVFTLILTPQYLISQIRENSNVVFIQGSVFNSKSNELKLLDGSCWYSASAYFALIASDIFIIITDEKGNGIAYCNGNEFYVQHISGRPIQSNGRYTKVIRELGDGAVLQLSDGTMWEVPKYDQYYTGYWLPPYPVIISSNELYMYNIKKGKKVWVTKVK